MKIVIIGGSGHVGTYLVPQLVRLGHSVINISRQLRQPYFVSDEWKEVEQITLDRAQTPAFGSRIAALSADVVIDMICFTKEEAELLVTAIQGEIQHFIHCGSMWVHGYSTCVPAREDQYRRPFCEYGTQKLAIETFLLKQAKNGFPATVLHPGHITGPGWLPVNPAGNLNPQVFRTLARGDKLQLPNLGMETLHHVHACDVASAFIQVINRPEASVAEAFQIVSEQAITLRGYAEVTSSWFGKQADLEFICWDQWKRNVPEEDARLTWDHIAHSPNGSIEKAKRLLEYQPRYSCMEAVKEAVDWQIAENNLLTS